jgi:F-type H+-transporting ATPase subunit delta
LKALAERYANALVDVALENKQADQVKQELAAFAAMVRESDDLHAFLANPSITRAIKHAAIEQLVARMGASRTLRNYLFVIVDQRRAGMLIEIEQAFSALLDARQGITQATVTSAVELTSAERAEIDAALAKLTGRKVQAQCTTDPGLIGGAVVRIGSTIYDGSVRAQLDRLRAKMISE